MTDADKPDPSEAPSQSTAFDLLVERVKRELAEGDGERPHSHHVSKLHAIFETALAEIGDRGANAAHQIQGGAEKVREQMKAHPMTTISSAFAAGYFVGKAIAGKARK